MKGERTEFADSIKKCKQYDNEEQNTLPRMHILPSVRSVNLPS